MLTAIDVQQHARQRSPRTPLSMHAPFASARHQSGSLQHPLHPAVTELDLMLGRQLFVKVAHVEIEVALPVELEHPLQHRQWHPFRRRHAPPSIESSPNPTLLRAPPPAVHLPIGDANDLRRLPPCDLLRCCPQNHFLYFHRPLRRGSRVGIHASHGLLSSPPAKRTYHLLIRPDISCANDSTLTGTLTFMDGAFTLGTGTVNGFGIATDTTS